MKRNEEPGRSPDRDVVSKSELATVLPAKHLADACCQLLIDLHQVATTSLASQGIAQNATAEKWQAIEKGHFEPSGNDSDFEEAPSEQLDADDRAELEAAMEGRVATALDRALRKEQELVEVKVRPPLHPDDVAPNPSPRGREVQKRMHRATGAIDLETSLKMEP